MTLTSRDVTTVSGPGGSPSAPLPVSESTAHRDRPYRRWVRRAAAVDVVAAGLAVVLAWFVRFGGDGAEAAGGATLSYPVLSLIVALLWPAILILNNAYDLRAALFGVEELRRVIRAGASLLAALGVAHFFFKLNLSRGYVAILIPALVSTTALSRTLLRTRDKGKMAAGWGQHRAVAVGPAAELSELCTRLATVPGTAIDVIAFVADDLAPEDPVPAPLERLRRLPDRAAIQRLADHGVEMDLLVRAGRPHPEEMAALARRAHEAGVTVAIAPHRGDSSANMAVSYVPLGWTPLLVVETPTLKPAAAALKSVLDRLMAAVGLVVLSPLMLGIGLLIAVRDGRPVLFRQERVGRDGRPFCCLKFRTMVAGAEGQLAGLQHRNEAAGPLFKLREDPRTTRTGRRLRRRSLDELPQLFNVLKGEMSIVGPRPPLPSEAATYDERTARRLLVKPGMTGLWQVEGRSDLPWDDGVYLDLLYVDHWSPLLDFVIMARTLKSVLRPNGAY